MTDIDILRQISEGRRTFIPEREQAPFPEFRQTCTLLFSLENKKYVKEVVTRWARHDQPSRNYYTSPRNRRSERRGTTVSRSVPLILSAELQDLFGGSIR